MDTDTCLLCEGRDAKRRAGRLGRYSQTCDECEERRGSNLHTSTRSLVDTGPMRAATWVRTGSR